MYLKNEDLELLKDIELYLYNKNKDNVIICGNMFAIKSEEIEDADALQLYFRLYATIEKMQNMKVETNEKNYNRIAAKRKTDKNYARKNLGNGKYL